MKRIIICADGTWNVRDQVDKETKRRRPTNVTKIARAIKPRDSGIDQVVFYHEGIGTGGPLDRITGGAFGKGMGRNLRDIYRFIVYNYEPDDELFFFGFSRGSFTVRTVIGFMSKFGLVEKDDDYFVPDIFDCYESNEQPGSDKWKHAFRKVVGTRPCPQIKFAGVWDTVGALGAPGLLGWFTRNKYRFHDVTLNKYIENAYHALALDERRRPFKPDLWTRPDGWNGKLEQAWFAGVHSNIGGGYPLDGLANEALHWIVEKAEACGLVVDPVYLKPFKPCFNSVLENSMTPKYWLLVPYTRPVGQVVNGNEFVHQSALDRRGFPACEYSPKNLSSPSVLPVVNTSRIGRGTAC